MWEQFDFWKFFAGLGIFLFGMSQIELALRTLGGRAFKEILRKNTNNRFKAILSGTAITALLQSSSVVSLMVIALVGAGLMKLTAALGIIIGSNLGTTFTGWIVASLGFKFSIEAFALPLLGIGSMVFILLEKYEKPANIGRLLAGFGLLFLGLDFMKISIDYLAQNFDLTPYVDYGPFVFLIVGFVFTALIQSSSATMVITLSALHSGIIPFSAATALVIGADLGTTITALIGGMPGKPIKKRVAMGHFLFNLVTDTIAFILLVPIGYFVTDILGIKDPLLALVAFHSSFNLLGILIFVPAIPYFARFLSNRFRKDAGTVVQYVNNVDPKVTSAAMEALEKDVRLLFTELIKLQDMAFERQSSRFWSEGHEVLEQYYRLKQFEGELFVFYNNLQQQQLSPEESRRLNQLILSIRHILHSAKSIKDIENNLRDLESSGSKTMLRIYAAFRDQQQSFLSAVRQLLETEESNMESLSDIATLVQNAYSHIEEMTSEKKFRRKPAVEVSTVLTINREIYSSQKSMIYALNQFKFPAELAREFGNLQITTP